MTADELYRAGKINDAIEAQIQAVKAAPADHAKRMFLFELCVFAGDLERAKRQIELINFDEPELQVVVVTYRRLLDSEATRRKVFSEGLPPKVLGDNPPEHAKLRIEALARLHAGHEAEAIDLLEKAFEASPNKPGKIDGKPFASLRDCDDVLGPMIEGSFNGEYFWIPLDDAVRLDRKPHKYPRDLYWAPATLEMTQSQGEVYLSAIYAMTHTNGDDQLKLGRGTDWLPTETGPTRGIGLKLFDVDGETTPVLGFTTIEFD